MNMLTDKDIKRIGEEMGKVLEQNVMPQFEFMHEKFEDLDGRLTKVEATMVTKDYLDDKLADLRGEFFLKLKQA